MTPLACAARPDHDDYRHLPRYVMAADVDFVPYPPRPSAALRRDLERLNVREGSPNVLVLAAFES